MLTSPDEVIEFWFGEPATSEAELFAKMKRWYMGGPALDQEIQEHYGALVDQAVAGELDAWASDAQGRVALIVLLDQFTRSIYRDKPGAYAGDQRAQRLSIEAFDTGLHRDLSIDERLFLLMPLMHAEDLALQERAVTEVARIVEEAPPALRGAYSMGIEQSRKYRDIIQRFGRFPHRNVILGRTSTPAEQEFLESWAQNAPPTQMRNVE
jgi:uncharacterized protein (DUF924 family)